MIFAELPKCSRRVNRSKQSIRDLGSASSCVGVPLAALFNAFCCRKYKLTPRSREMSQNGSIVVDTPLWSESIFFVEKNQVWWWQLQLKFVPATLTYHVALQSTSERLIDNAVAAVRVALLIAASSAVCRRSRRVNGAKTAIAVPMQYLCAGNVKNKPRLLLFSIPRALFLIWRLRLAPLWEIRERLAARIRLDDAHVSKPDAAARTECAATYCPSRTVVAEVSEASSRLIYMHNDVRRLRAIRTSWKRRSSSHMRQHERSAGNLHTCLSAKK